MAIFGLVLRPDRDEAVGVARTVVHWCGEHQHRCLALPEDAGRLGSGVEAVDAATLAHGTDAVITLGGDGTILSTVALLEGSPVPIIGVNLGQLGYLTEIEPTAAPDALANFLAGRHRIEDRMLLSVVLHRSEGQVDTRYEALNEAVIEKKLSGHTVRIEVDVDEVPFTPYEADALIVATPTGSTAYAFSARGPILSATHRALLLTPVSPHMLFDRSLVLEPDSRIGLVVRGPRVATLTIDGRTIATLEAGDRVVCTASNRSVRLVRFGDRNFASILKTKFRLSDR